MAVLGAGWPARSASYEGWATGIEPATSGTTIRRSNQLSYAHHQCKLGLKTKGKQEARKACFLAYSRPWRARRAGAEESGRSGLRARTQGTSPRRLVPRARQDSNLRPTD